MTDNLTWLLTKNFNSSLVRRNGVEFSKEKFNMMNRNCRTYSGFAAVKGADLSLNAESKIVFTTKTKKSKFPSQSSNSVNLIKGKKSVGKAIDSQLTKNYYRSDLSQVTKARWSVLNRLAKVELKSKAGSKCSSRGLKKLNKVVA